MWNGEPLLRWSDTENRTLQRRGGMEAHTWTSIFVRTFITQLFTLTSTIPANLSLILT